MYLQVALDQAIKAVCPIHGVSFGNLSDKSTWRIDYKDEATEDERKQAVDVLNAFVWDEAKEAEAKKQSDIETKKADPNYKLAYATYLLSNPTATFEDFISYLDSIKL